MFYLFLAEGFEETEAVATVDILRRAGIEVKTAGVTEKTVSGSHGIKIECDISADEAVIDNSLSGIILPGGMPGTTNLEKSKAVLDAIDYCASHDKYLFAICAAPSIFGHKNLLNGKNAVCYPSFEKDLYGAVISDDKVCRDGNFITAKGSGVTIDFALKIVETVISRDIAEKIKESLQ